MTRLIKDDKPILDGTRPLYRVEQEIFRKLGKIEELMECWEVDDLRELDRILNLHYQHTHIKEKLEMEAKTFEKWQSLYGIGEPNGKSENKKP